MTDVGSQEGAGGPAAAATRLPVRAGWLGLGAFAGLAAAVVMTAGWVVAGLLQPSGYDWASQEISDLGALTADHAWVWNLADSLSGALLSVFAVVLYAALGATRRGRLGALLIGTVGVGSILDGLLREDCPLSTSRACQRLRDGPGLSWHHFAHDVESIVVFAAMVAAPFVLAGVFARYDELRPLRAYTRLTGLVLVASSAAYLALYGNLGGGIAQRLVTLAYMTWIAAISLILARGTGAPHHPSRNGEIRPDGTRTDPLQGEMASKHSRNRGKP